MELKGLAGKDFEATIRLKTDAGVLVWRPGKHSGSWGDFGPHQPHPGDHTINTWRTRCDGILIEFQDKEYVGELPYQQEKRSQAIIINSSGESGLGYSYLSNQKYPPDPTIEYYCTTMADLADSLKKRDNEHDQKIREQEIDAQNKKIRKCLKTLDIDDPDILKMF